MFLPPRRFCLFAAAALMGCGCTEPEGSEPPPDLAPPDSVRDALSSILSATVDEELPPGAALTVAAPDWGSTTLTVGVSDAGSGEAVTADHLFPVSSVTKTFTAALIHRQVEVGTLSLDSSVAAWLPDLGLDPAIEVGHLLDHTSGIPDYGALDGYAEASAIPAPPSEVVDFALAEPMDFDPGTGITYSNTAYIVAGMLLEEVTGRPFEVHLREELLDPLEVSAAALRSESSIPGEVVASHFLGTPTEQVHPSWAWSAHGLVATPAATCDWLALLLRPDAVLQAASLDAMLVRPEASPGELAPYGRGVKVVAVSGIDVVGHPAASGGSGGFVFLHRPSGTCVSMFVNEWAFDRDSTIDEIWTRLVELEPERFAP